ncbi:hypothetical protein ACQYAD_10170 [Neobacillus sp. SM06]|uniref:hypothetical protein n=1 Tax=Neobacillus sp. SM06 TaxID=3422492 RepID=UPI003D29D00A
MIQQNLSSETNIKLPFSFIFFSLLALIISQIILLGDGKLMVQGSFENPAIWSAAHFLILGWALMIAMGAMYQLVPVAFLTKIWNERFGFVQFFTMAIGVISFAAMLYWSPQKAFIPGIIALIGILMFLLQMFMTLKKQAKPTILTAFVGSALVSLLVTIFLGLNLIYFFKTGMGGESHEAIFKSHMLMGITGWFTLLIFGFSYKMVPMFSLSHGFSMIQARYVYGFYVSGLLVTLAALFSGSPILLKLGFFLMLLGFTTFSWHVKIILKKRLKKKLDKPFRFSIAAIGFGNVIHLLAFLLLWTNYVSDFLGPLIYAYLMLWIVLSILGYLYKIVPFLWWTHKYSSNIGKKSVPTLKEMINEKTILPLFGVFIGSAILVFFALSLKLSLLFTIGQIIIAVVFITMALNIISVIKK